MKTRFAIGVAIVCLTTGLWTLPACGNDVSGDQQRSYYLKCISDEIDNYSCKVLLVKSRSGNLREYGVEAAQKVQFLTKNREALLQEMIAQKVSLRPHAVHEFLLRRFNAEAPVQMAKD